MEQLVANINNFTLDLTLTVSKCGGGLFTKTLVCIISKLNCINNKRSYKNSSILIERFSCSFLYFHKVGLIL